MDITYKINRAKIDNLSKNLAKNIEQSLFHEISSNLKELKYFLTFPNIAQDEIIQIIIKANFMFSINEILNNKFGL